ncbi:hypothetical protein P344_03610 [Spiroplasma mirum ATCC 29335]|uniref:Uncharacterized protein n=1 Tax=Spiroplasma mirum ATCC 29335 TaxID=838561 RepID=W0GLH7_9MOLU|nr:MULTISPECIES: hypothetical protein [Spiroplasma]AHF61032.1 hypothetical protein SMM_0607 [Spiroplasma mirum ATCC 29335]AHI58063.1 hypothetical protein P344_03610 [Spiroplasma mirum ATCC 29335]
MSNKKVIDYWNDDDNSYIDPAKRPTSIMKKPTIEPLHDNKRKIENNVESWDDYYNYSATLIDDKVNSSDYDELAEDDVIDPLRNFKDAEIDQIEELGGELDELNLGNKNRFVNDDETNYNNPQPILNVNEMHERWKANKQNSVQERLNFLRHRSQEPKIKGRQKYNFLVPKSLTNIIKKPNPVVIDATPTAGSNEVFGERRFFNNPNLIKKVQNQDKEDMAEEVKTNSFNEEGRAFNPLLQNILQAAKQNKAEVNKEAIFINNDDFLDPDHLTPAQRLKLLKAANDPNDQQRKQILQMKLNRGVMGSLSQVVKERLHKLENGELELVEDANENGDDNKK